MFTLKIKKIIIIYDKFIYLTLQINQNQISVLPTQIGKLSNLTKLLVISIFKQFFFEKTKILTKKN